MSGLVGGEMEESLEGMLLVSRWSSPAPLPLLCGDGSEHHTCISTEQQAWRDPAVKLTFAEK